MCGRVTLLTYDELSEVLRAVEARRKRLPLIERFEQDGAERRQARPGSVVDTLTPHDGTLAITPLKWGFDRGEGSLAFNTRIESALGRARFWADAIEKGRCILPVASFFEPHATRTAVNPRTRRLAKQQFEFASPACTPLLLACVSDGEHLSVVTTEPNDVVAPIHQRMPLVLDVDELPIWLDGEYATLADRSRLSLSAAPERADASSSSPQLSLFPEPKL